MTTAPLGEGMSLTTETQPAFSVAVIARNEAHNLPRLIGTLTGFMRAGGEVVLVDTGSADDTLRVAEEAGWRVCAAGHKFDAVLSKSQARQINQHFAAPGEGPLVGSGERLFHFAQARQYAAEFARNDMVFFVDGADEVLALDVGRLDEQIRSAGVQRFKYWRDYTFDTDPTRVVAHQFACFYDRRLLHWEGRTHEALYVNDANEAPTPRTVLCTREHLALRHTQDTRKSRRFYLPGLALDLIERPTHERWMFYFGRELYYSGKPRSALRLLETHANLEGAWAAERVESLCLAGAAHERLRAMDKAEACYQRAVDLGDERREPRLRLADLAVKRGDFLAGVNAAKAALEIPGPGPYIELTANFTHRPHAVLYWCLFWLGQIDEARSHWEMCRSQAPDNERFEQDRRLFET